MEASGKDLQYLDPKTNTKYTPNIVEASVGVDRTFLAVLTEAYNEEEVEGGGTRVVLKLPRVLAPVKCAVMPLLKNKPALVAKAEEVFNMLNQHMVCEFDASGNIGKSYRRQDEIGTPKCVTIDFGTIGEEDGIEQDTVTIRDRDTLEQKRIKIEDLLTELA
jgi:glycyl-tRNA synthetase